MAAPVAYPPLLGSPQPVRFPFFDVRTLRNGLRVYAARVARVPLVRMDLLVPAGAIHDGPDQSGIATLTTALLDEGLTGSTATEIVEELGGSLYTGATWNTAVANITLLSDHLEEGVRLLARVVLDATFPEREVERLRRQRLANLRQQQRVPSFMAEQVLARSIYQSTVYGRPLYGNVQTIAALRRDDFLAFHTRLYDVGRMALVAVGDFEIDALHACVDEVFSSAATQRSTQSVDLSAPSPRGVSVHIVDTGSAPQVHVRLGHVGPPYAHPRFTMAEMMNSVFGGRSTSRINIRLRERLGYTYSAQSHFAARLGPGPFEIWTAVPPQVAAETVAAILEELDAMRRRPVGADELEQTRQYLRARWTTQLQTIEGIVNKLSLLAVFRLNDDHFDRELQAIAHATAEDLQTAAQAFLAPEHLAIVGVGPQAGLLPAMRRFGPVETCEPMRDR